METGVEMEMEICNKYGSWNLWGQTPGRLDFSGDKLRPPRHEENPR